MLGTCSEQGELLALQMILNGAAQYEWHGEAICRSRFRMSTIAVVVVVSSVLESSVR